MNKRKGVYYLPFVNLVGGCKTILENNAGLIARGWDCEIFAVSGDASWFNKPTKIRLFPNTDQLGTVLASFSGVSCVIVLQGGFR